MSEWPWSVLDIDPTADERELKRVYARQLKLHRPDRDPEGFQSLRSAFDAALQSCQFAIMEADVEPDEVASLSTPANDTMVGEEAGRPDAGRLSGDVLPDAVPTVFAANAVPAPLPCEVELDQLWSLTVQHEEGNDAAMAALVRLLNDPRLTLPGVRPYVEKRLLQMISQLEAGSMLWPQASACFGWDVDDPAFQSEWPQAAVKINHDRLAAWADEVVTLCRQDASAGLQSLKTLLDNNALVSVDLRLAFYQRLAEALVQQGGVNRYVFTRLCELVGWQADGFCPRELSGYLWNHLQLQVEGIESTANDQLQWTSMQGVVAGQVAAPSGERRLINALFASGRTLWLRCLFPGLTDQVRERLAFFDLHHPGIEERLPPETVAFWRFKALCVPEAFFGSICFWLTVAGVAAQQAAMPWVFFCTTTVVFLYVLWLDPQLDHLLRRVGDDSVFWLQAFRGVAAAGLLAVPLYKLGVLSTVFTSDEWVMYVLGAGLVSSVSVVLSDRGLLFGFNLRLAAGRLFAMGPFGVLRYCMRRTAWFSCGVYSVGWTLVLAGFYDRIIVDGFMI